MRHASALTAVLLVLLTTAAQADRTLVVDQHHPQAADTNAGTPEAPLQTISAAAKLVEPGDTVLIRSGTYREQVTIERGGTADTPIVFRADLAAHVVVTGADVLGNLRHESGEANIYSADWPHVFIGWNPTHTHPADDYHALVGRCEQVFVNGYSLQQALNREQLSRGTFFVDEPGKRLYLWGFHNEDLTRQLVEASTRSLLLDVKAPYVHTHGLRFRYAANMAQHGAVALSGQGDVLEDCVCERMNSIGASFVGPDLVVRRCTFADNGQMGFSAGGAHSLLFTGCVVRNNNTKGWNRGWEAGGDKLCMSRGVVIEQSQFLGNRGNGIWFDIGNEDCTVRNCLIADNEDCGIFYEISYGLHAHDNVIMGNGFAVSPGAWGAQAAISLSSSPGCVIERNLMIGNKEGFNFREQGRTTPRIGKQGGEEPVWNHDQTVRNNVIAYNRDAQTWGWFDVLDERHFPAALQVAAQFIAPTAGEGAMNRATTLDQLKIAFANNLYAIQPGQELFNWGCAWRHHERFANLAQVQGQLNLEQGSRLADFVFGDYLTRDFRVPADSPAVAMKCVPQGRVPGVELGMLAR